MKEAFDLSQDTILGYLAVACLVCDHLHDENEYSWNKKGLSQKKGFRHAELACLLQAGFSVSKHPEIR